MVNNDLYSEQGKGLPAAGAGRKPSYFLVAGGSTLGARAVIAAIFGAGFGSLGVAATEP